MTHEEENMIVFAARYAHGRNVGAPLAVVRYVMSVWNELSTDVKETVISESHEAQTCPEDWKMLRDFAEKENR